MRTPSTNDSRLVFAWLVFVTFPAAGCGEHPTTTTKQSVPRAPEPVPLADSKGPLVFERQEPFEVRPLRPAGSAPFTGAGVSYGPYRDGQRPGGFELPTTEQIAEDLAIIARHWKLLRLYGTTEHAELILQTIRDCELPLRVMVGAWITSETVLDEQTQIIVDNPVGIETNRWETRTAIHLANAFPGIVVAVSVGNESQVEWSDHKIASEQLIQYIRQVRAATNVPVTTADDFTWWKSDASQAVADEIDFLVTHVYAMWHGRQLEEAMEFTKQSYHEVQARHPEKTVVLGEAGWATNRHSDGEAARLMAGKAGEPEQKRFFDDFTAWSKSERIVTFYFEAFDENWKGSPHPDDVEKHWGLYSADRRPKLALANEAN